MENTSYDLKRFTREMDDVCTRAGKVGLIAVLPGELKYLWAELDDREKRNSSLQKKVEDLENELARRDAHASAEQSKPVDRASPTHYTPVTRKPKLMRYELPKLASEGRVEELEEYLNAGVDPTVCDNHALLMATMNNHPEVVRLLLKHPAVDPTVRDCDIFRQAVKDGNDEIVRIFLEDGRVKCAQ